MKVTVDLESLTMTEMVKLARQIAIEELKNEKAGRTNPAGLNGNNKNHSTAQRRGVSVV